MASYASLSDLERFVETRAAASEVIARLTEDGSFGAGRPATLDLGAGTFVATAHGVGYWLRAVDGSATIDTPSTADGLRRTFNVHEARSYLASMHRRIPPTGCTASAPAVQDWLQLLVADGALSLIDGSRRYRLTDSADRP